MIVLIPAYQPDIRLLTLGEELLRRGHGVLVVDDGSAQVGAGIFAALAERGVEVLHHDRNRGKGAALKTGFRHLMLHRPGAGAVCADADGQHTVEDIERVATAMDGRSLVLGAREFVGEVHLRSRFGNGVTRRLFGLVTGRRLADTQTGLRGVPAALLGWLDGIPGERFEYEFEVLLRAAGGGVPVVEVPIETRYLEGNASSHFRPVRDSLRVYRPLAAFAASSLIGFGIDTVALMSLMALTGQLATSVVGARLLSGTANYLLNRHAVFVHGRQRTGSAWRYALVAAGVLGANYLVLSLLTGGGVPLLAAKLLTEVLILAGSFLAQRSFVFTHDPNSANEAAAGVGSGPGQGRAGSAPVG